MFVLTFSRCIYRKVCKLWILVSWTLLPELCAQHLRECFLHWHLQRTSWAATSVPMLHPQYTENLGWKALGMSWPLTRRDRRTKWHPRGYRRGQEPSSHTQVGKSQFLPFSTVGLLQETGGPWNLNLSWQVPLHFDQCVLTNANFDKNKSDELILAIEPILLWRVCFDKGWADTV